MLESFPFHFLLQQHSCLTSRILVLGPKGPGEGKQLKSCGRLRINDFIFQYKDRNGRKSQKKQVDHIKTEFADVADVGRLKVTLRQIYTFIGEEAPQQQNSSKGS